MKFKYLIMSLLLISLVLPFVNAETLKLGEQSNITIDCLINSQPQPTATANLTLQKEGGSFIIQESAMTNLGGGKYVYSISMPENGKYIATGSCCVGSLCWSTNQDILVTPSGDTRGFSLVLILAIAAAVVFAFGYFTHNVWFVYISGIMFLVLGVYTIINGFNNIRDTYTDVIGYVAIGFSIMFFVVGAYEQLSGNGEDD